MNIFSCCFGTSQPESPPHTRPNSPEKKLTWSDALREEREKISTKGVQVLKIKEKK